MYELLDQIRRLEIELAQALNRAKDSVALLEEAVQRLKDHRLELEAGESEMTKDEIGDIVVTISQGLGANEFIYHLVNRAVELEREACAKVCEQLGMATNGMNERNYECAQAIRARGEK